MLSFIMRLAAIAEQKNNCRFFCWQQTKNEYLGVLLWQVLCLQSLWIQLESAEQNNSFCAKTDHTLSPHGFPSLGPSSLPQCESQVCHQSASVGYGYGPNEPTSWDIALSLAWRRGFFASFSPTCSSMKCLFASVPVCCGCCLFSSSFASSSAFFAK